MVFFLKHCRPNGYFYLSANRKERNGGELAKFYHGSLHVKNFSIMFFTNAVMATLEITVTLDNSLYLWFVYADDQTPMFVFL